jgi:pilus assembly protein CpaC
MHCFRNIVLALGAAACSLLPAQAQVALNTGPLNVGSAPTGPSVSYEAPNSYPASGTSQLAVRRIELAVGKSTVVQVDTRVADLVLGDPTVADVLPLTSNSVYVLGKKAGSTTLSIYGPGRTLISALDLNIGPDLDGLRAMISETMPGENSIQVRSANGSVILSGIASSAPRAQRMASLADSFAPGKVVNMLGVGGSQQVMLSVRIAEVSRTASKALRLNTSAIDNTGANRFTGLTGDQFANGNNAPADAFGLGALSWVGGKYSFDVLFEALEERGQVRTLAEPTLVAMSGDTASFLAGGEFPVPIARDDNAGTGRSTVTIEFKQFGVSLSFTPTVLEDGVINLNVAPEVSSIDINNSVTAAGFRIPGLKTRRANTTVELRDGESFVIAGLLNTGYENEIRQLPFAGDLPILGSLFRSSGFRKDETELAIIVTPRLASPTRHRPADPISATAPPTQPNLFLNGQTQGTVRPSAPVRAEHQLY